MDKVRKPNISVFSVSVSVSLFLAHVIQHVLTILHYEETKMLNLNVALIMYLYPHSHGLVLNHTDFTFASNL
jgi:hypothetical protein